MAKGYYWALYWIAGLAVVYWVWTSENRWAKDEEPSPSSKEWIKLQKLVDEWPPVAYMIAIFLWLLWPINALAQLWWTIKRLIQGKAI